MSSGGLCEGERREMEGRSQKLLEEGPSPVLTPEVGAPMEP